MTRLEGGCVAFTSAVRGAGEYPRLWVGLDFSASQDAAIMPGKSTCHGAKKMNHKRKRETANTTKTPNTTKMEEKQRRKQIAQIKADSGDFGMIQR